MMVKARGIRFNVDILGPENAPVVMLSNSLATTMDMWQLQLPALTEKYRVVRYDMRGHGQTEVTKEAYTLEGLAEDAIALMDALELDKVNFVGLSIGGMIGQVIALNFPERLNSLVICSSTSSLSFADPVVWEERMGSVQSGGMAAQAQNTIERWLSAPFIADNKDVVRQVREMIEATPVDGYIASCRALLAFHITERLPSIDLPVLVMPGALDQATPPILSEIIHENIPGSILKVIEDAAHLTNIQQSAIFNKSLLNFLEGV
ncbi:MAG: alpha/beta fold hydrolase [Alphaproteobacteria bacterium]|nr:alpha/beta fold hydrolase [Rhodospirillales bacterium]MCW9044980.1 alpha/beta fold hydrolase [Alphaproteobacteria bacterium]